MALIICPECSKDVSDQATVCPNCGYPLFKVDSSQTVNVTPAQRVEIVDVNLKGLKKKTKKIILIGSVAIILIIAIIGSVLYLHTSTSMKAYKANLSEVTNLMLSGASSAESAGNLIKSVWYNTIYEEDDYTTNKYTKQNGGSGDFYDDFNDALANLFIDTSFQAMTSDIENNQDSVKELMKALANPPKDENESYQALKDYYDAYLELTELVINPTGSFTTFSTNFNTADSNTAKYYKQMQIYIE